MKWAEWTWERPDGTTIGVTFKNQSIDLAPLLTKV